MMIESAIKKIVDKQDLTYDEAYAVMDEIMSGESTPTQNAAYLAALSTKSAKAESIDEILGSAQAMRAHATPVPHPGMEVLEIVGTGGDHSHSFNISTTSMFVAAAGGVHMAKHGNRAASSKSGAADCLEALGANIEQPPELASYLLKKVSLCFLFAQLYHKSSRYVGPIRKELGIRTVFNILGPLTNPAQPEFFVLGVYDEYLVEPLAKVLSAQGVRHGLVVHGLDMMDEISIGAPTVICEIRDGFYRTSQIAPEDFGLPRGERNELVGGTGEDNARILRQILSGEDRGARRNVVLLNSAATLFSANIVDSLKDGVAYANQLIDSGAPYELIDTFVQESHHTF